MSSSGSDCYPPPIDAQLRYTVEWFREFSEMQRDDFLPILAQKLAPGSYAYVNGLVSGVENLACNEGRPPSLFQCRIKLFREWFETWGQAEKDQLLNKIKDMDPEFYSKIQEELSSVKTGNGPLSLPEVDDADKDVENDVVEPVESEAKETEDLESDVPKEESCEDALATEDVDSPVKEE